MRIRCNWHKWYFPKEEEPYLIAGGIAKKGYLNAICPRCFAIVAEDVKKKNGGKKNGKVSDG